MASPFGSETYTESVGLIPTPGLPSYGSGSVGLFGGWFGIELDKLPESQIKDLLLRIRLINPMTDTLLFMGLTFVLGFIQIWFSQIVRLYHGIKINKECDSNEIFNNIITGNKEYGVLVISSCRNKIHHNIINSNGFGVGLINPKDGANIPNNNIISDIKLTNKRPPRSAISHGYTKRYKVYLKKRKRCC